MAINTKTTRNNLAVIFNLNLLNIFKKSNLYHALNSKGFHGYECQMIKFNASFIQPP